MATPTHPLEVPTRSTPKFVEIVTHLKQTMFHLPTTSRQPPEDVQTPEYTGLRSIWTELNESRRGEKLDLLRLPQGTHMGPSSSVHELRP